MLKSNFDVASLTSYYTLSSYERGRNRRGISKRRYYRVRGSHGAVIRRRRGTLGHMLAFIASKLVLCTKSMVITPSCYLMERVISMFFQRSVSSLGNLL